MVPASVHGRLGDDRSDGPPGLDSEFHVHHMPHLSIYLLNPQIYLKICLSEKLYLSVSRISLKPFTPSPSRSAGMLHGSRECAPSRVRLFRCEQVIHLIEFRGRDTLMFTVLPSTICRGRIGRQMVPLGPWRTI